MMDSSHSIPTKGAAGAILTIAACISLIMYVRSGLKNPQIRPEPVERTRARTKLDWLSKSETQGLPYPPNVLPGEKDVETEYGSIRINEWGPENGDKVLMLHGIATPSPALGDMAKCLVERGCRVMLFDFFGRGYSDSPTGVPYDERLYTSQILLVLASSRLSWTGTQAFHLIGYSLGGCLAAPFAVYHANLLKSVTLVCPAGLIRESHVDWRSWFLYSERLLPVWIAKHFVRRRIQPKGASGAEVPLARKHEAIEFDRVQVYEGRDTTIGDLIRWQLDGNAGFVGAYLSTLQYCPIYQQHDRIWKKLEEVLRGRRVQAEGYDALLGLPGGQISIILADEDSVISADEWVQDSKAVLGEDGVDIRIIHGGHELPITDGRQIAMAAIEMWEKRCPRLCSL